MKYIKYLLFVAVLIVFSACNDEEDFYDQLENPPVTVTPPALTAGSANFSNFVSIGNSLTAGFTDGALFMASQEHSFPNTLAKKFALVGGGSFTQPLMNDNFGGLALGGTRLTQPRLVFGGAGPVPLESVIGPVTVTTDLAVNNPTGPFNNFGVPGAASFHLVAPGYGNIANLAAGLANPYFVRMTGATPDATVMELAMAQSPTFVSLWIGANDVLGYALGGAATGAPTPQTVFDGAMALVMGSLGDVQGVMANIPYVTSIPYFTTVSHDVVPLDAATAGAVNSAYAAYNAAVQGLVGIPPVMMTQEEADSRMINFEESDNNAVVIMDETLSDLTVFDPALISMRQATMDDLLILPSASFIGTEAVPGNPLTVNGVAIPLADNWVLIPSEQDEIRTAIDGFNATISSSANAAGFAFVDANAVFQQMSTGGYPDGEFILTSDLVTGGALSLDGVHGTARGYALVANLFLQAIDATYGSNFEESENLVDIGEFPTNYSPFLD